jgi:subtilisin family serine protease
MEVRHAIGAVFFLLALTGIGCSKTKTPHSVYRKVSDECASQAIPGRHVARWNTGDVILIEGGSREEVIADFVTPNLDKLDLVEPDYRVELRSAGDLPASVLASADNWGVLRINAGAAWTRNVRGGGVTVAVVDTGMDAAHTQLVNQIAYNKGETGTDAAGRDRATNGVDDDNNGIVDDVSGYDFAANSTQVQDYVSHGTHVSGIIAAEHSDSQPGSKPYVQGVAPAARILPLAFMDRSGSGSLYNAMRAIDYAVIRGARVINASWGGAGCSTVLRDQIAGLHDKNVIFVAAAGNSGMDIDFLPEYPAAFNLLAQLTVGSVSSFDARAEHSNYGDRAVHLFAPGVEIVSTLPQNNMGTMTGTSMATPFVAGAVALLLSHRPQATIEQVREALYAAAHRDWSYKNASRGRLDLSAALSELEQRLQ